MDEAQQIHRNLVCIAPLDKKYIPRHLNKYYVTQKAKETTLTSTTNLEVKSQDP